MIKTGLPYDMDKMDEILGGGASVDMSEVSFPGIEADKQYATALIYFRNTGTENITLDFSHCSYEQKANFLKEFMTSHIDADLPEAVDAWYCVLHYMTFGKVFEGGNIFNEQELKRFTSENGPLADELLMVLVSLPVYMLSSNSLVEDKDVFEKAVTEHIAKNYLQLLRHPLIEGIIFGNTDKAPKFYTDIYTEDNNELFAAVSQNLMFAPVLYGMITADSDEWEKAMNSLGGKS